MKNLLLIIMLLAVTKIYGQTITNLTAPTIGTTTATLTCDYDLNGEGFIYQSRIIISTNSNLSSPIRNWVSAADDADAFTITYNATSLTPATTYYYRFRAMFEISGLIYSPGAPYSTFTTLAAAPTTQAHTIALSNTTSGTIDIKWTQGNGNRRICMASTSPTGFPTSANLDTKDYTGPDGTANADFGSAPTNIAKILYDGTDNGTTGFTATGLSANTTYYFKVIEYNNTGTNTKYSDAAGSVNPGNATTLTGPPTNQASLIVFPTLGSNTMTINWTNGTGANRIVAVREATQGTITPPTNNTTYSASTDWSIKGTQLGGSGYYIVSNGNSSTVSLTNLAVNTTYWVQIFEYNGGAGTEIYMTTGSPTNNPNSKATLKLTPTAQSTDILFTNIASSTMTVSWTRPISGGGDYCLVVAESGGAANTPVDGTDYAASPSFSTGTPSITGTGTSYAVYEGTGTSVNITNLAQGTTYHFKVYEFNNTGTGNTKYFLSDGTSGNPNNEITGPATWDGSTSTNWNTASNWDLNTVPSSRSVVIPSGGNQPIIATSETHSINDLTINAGASLTINGTGDLNVLGAALLKTPSSDGAAGQVIVTDNNGHFDITGTSTMERYYPAPVSSRWRLVSSPLQNTFINRWSGFWVDAWDESLDVNSGQDLGWVHLTQNSNISVMQGLSVYKIDGTSTTCNFIGAFNNGPISYNTTKVNFGWNLIGNPYPSAIYWSTAGVTLTNVGSFAYLYNPNGSYTTIDINSPSFIAAGQAFFVQASGSGSVAFTNAARAASAQTFLKSAAIELPQLRLQAKNTIYSTEALIRFHDDATSGFDPEFDATIRFSDNDSISDIYTSLGDGSNLVFNTFNTEILNSISTQEFKIPLGLTKGSAIETTVSLLNAENFPENINIFLHDKISDTYTNLRNGSANLEIIMNSTSRFEIILKTNSVGVTEKYNSNPDILIYTYKKSAFVKSDLFIVNNANIYVYDIMGKLIVTKPTNYGNTHEININKPGTYIIKVITNKKVFTQKVVVQ